MKLIGKTPFWAIFQVLIRRLRRTIEVEGAIRDRTMILARSPEPKGPLRRRGRHQFVEALNQALTPISSKASVENISPRVLKGFFCSPDHHLAKTAIPQTHRYRNIADCQRHKNTELRSNESPIHASDYF